MTVGTIETKGTRLFFLNGPGSPQDILKVACPTGIEGLGGAGSQIATTCLDSQEMEYKRGMKDPSQINLPINFIPRSASHQALEALDESGEVVDWMIVFSDQDANPTAFADVDGVNNIVSPGATSVRFQGYVADLNINVQTNEIVRATITIQRTGAKEWAWPTADLD